MQKLKERLYQKCLAQLSAKAEALQQSLNSIEESRNNETKSSAGDKYETGRAMMQMEADKVSAQLDGTRAARSRLQQLSLSPSREVRLGSLVETSQRVYFLSIALGKVVVDGQPCFCISPEAPVARQLMGKKEGDRLEFNGRWEEVLNVY